MSRTAVQNLRKTLTGLGTQVEKLTSSWSKISSAVSEIALIYSSHYISVTRKVGNDPFEFDSVADAMKGSLKKHITPLENDILEPIQRLVPTAGYLEKRMDSVNDLAKSYRQRIEKYETYRDSENIKPKDLKALQDKLLKSQLIYDSSRKDLIEDMEDFFQHTYNFVDESFYKLMEKHAQMSHDLGEATSRIRLIAKKRGPSFMLFSKEYKREDDSLSILQNLDTLLTSEISVDYFQQFLHYEYSIENLLFLKAVLQLKEHKNPTDIERIANEIHRRFINAKGENQVNITGAQKKYVNDKIAKSEYSHTMFDTATKEVYDLMKSDTFPRFIKSSTCAELRRRLKRRHINFTTLFDSESIAAIDNQYNKPQLERKPSRLSFGFRRKNSKSNLTQQISTSSLSKIKAESPQSPCSASSSPHRSSIDRLSFDESTSTTPSSSKNPYPSIGPSGIRLKRWKKRNSVISMQNALVKEDEP